MSAASPDEGLTFTAIREAFRGTKPLVSDNRLRSGEIAPDPRPRRLFQLLDERAGLPLPPIATECGTPFYFVLAQEMPGLPPARTIELERLRILPRLQGEKIYTDATGRVRVHFTTDATSPDAVPAGDADANGAPALVESIAALAADSMAELGKLGWAWPANRTADIYLADIPRVKGYAVPDGSRPGSTAAIVLANTLGQDAKVLKRVVVHQLAHVFEAAAGLDEEPWFYEAAADWAALRLTGDLAPYAGALARRAQRPDLSLRTDSLALAHGGLLWALYLDGTAGPASIGRVVAESGRNPSPNLLESFEDVLLAADARDIRQHLRLYSLWNLATGPYASVGLYREARRLPAPAFETTIASFPGTHNAVARTPQGLGAQYLRLDLAPLNHGGLRIQFQGDATTTWGFDLVTIPLESSGYDVIPVEVGPDGAASASIPVGRYGEVLVVVRNQGLTPERGGAYSLQAAFDAKYPYDLGSFAGVGERGQVLLTWSTVREADVIGWRIHRAPNPEGPFALAGDLPVPAMGSPSEGADYAFVDTSVVPGERVYYRLDGITSTGLLEPSYVVSALPLPVEDERPPADR